MTRSKTKLILWLAGMSLIHLWLLWNVRSRLEEGYQDFTIFYTAGQIVRSGAGSQLYDGQLQFEMQQQFAPRVHIRQGPLPYNHPPFEALAFVPFTFLSYRLAYRLWGCINVLILFAVARTLRSWLPELRKEYPWYFWLLGCLGCFPIFIAIVQGQDVILLVWFYAIALAALKKNREFEAGCWLALGLIKPQLVLPAIFMLLLQKRKKAGFGFLCVAAPLVVISLAVVGWKALLKYPAYVWSLELSLGRAAIRPSVMPNLRGMVGDMLGEPAGMLVVTIAIALSLIVLILAAKEWRAARESETHELRVSLVMLATVLASYHAYGYDLSLLIIPVLLISEYTLRNSKSCGPLEAISLLGPTYLLFFTPLYLVLLLRIEHFSVMAIVLGLWFYGIRREIRGRTRLSMVAA